MARKTLLLLLGGALAAAPLLAQTTPPAAEPGQQSTTTTTTTTTTQEQQNPNIKVEPMEQTPTFKVNVVERTTQAVDYRDRGGSTEIQMRGTELMPSVTGDAKVTGRSGRLALNVSLKHMRPARDLGLPSLTYVLWAITPEGRPLNLGEILLSDDGDMKTQVTTSLSSFGLIVTAEPYFAVTRPSNVVVAENIIPNDVKGFIRTINAKFDLMERGQYTANLEAGSLPAAKADAERVPLQLLEARDAIAIAKAAGADQYASDTLRKAEEMLARAEDYYVRKQGTTPIGTASRSATQSAKDARLLTINKKEEERAEAARQRMRQQIESAQSEADANAARAKLAQQEAADELARRERAEQEREAAQRAAEHSEQARIAAEQLAQQSQQQLATAQQQQQLLQQQAQAAEQARAESERQAAEQRQKLVSQLNSVLATKDTARGVVSQMSDVLFDVNKATLKTDAQIRLAKISGIILSYPDLRLEIDGYTDSTGTPQWNQTLSEKRAASVRDFLVSQGVPIDNVTAKGLGQEYPIAPNTTAAGRKMNRRVELVLSGTAIGANNAPGANPPATTPAQPGAVAAPPPKNQ